MPEFKGTPGPWEVSTETFDPYRVNVAMNTFLHPTEPRVATEEDLEELGDDCHDDWNICSVGGDHYDRPSDEVEANARLIARSPKLLDLCQRMAAIIEYVPDMTGMLKVNELKQEAETVLAEILGGEQ